MKATSTVIKSFTYNQFRRQLTVKLKNGSVYRYSGVPEHEYAYLILSSSRGEFLNCCLKPLYPATRVV